MFESSLIDLEARPQSRRKWAPLPIALALHGVVLVSVGLAQVWNVAAVDDPEIVTPFRVTLVPSMAEGSRAAESRPVQKPATSAKPVQPDTKRLPDVPSTDSKPELPVGPTDLEGPPTEGGEKNVTEFSGYDSPLPFLDQGDDPAPIVPAAAPPKDEVLYVGGAVSRPVLLSGPPPRYTKLALRARVEGSVIVQAVIDEQGRVADVRVLRGLPMGLDQEAVEAVQNWTFEPAKLQGRPVKVYYSLTVNFRLQQ